MINTMKSSFAKSKAVFCPLILFGCRYSYEGPSISLRITPAAEGEILLITYAFRFTMNSWNGSELSGGLQ
ncbi:hypothetical protein CUU66_11925 [Peribacillus deserti]|uniref:Lipoprotein n=1 Tax=Peribacillus deserti TaxID=673318 RepID=A0A2N5M5H8_9BACI|nr:hypothetical protein CUU66_11925 [Peribacillus deserti]